jgi:hypothetical protein
MNLASLGKEKLFGIFDSYSETNLRIYNPFWVDLRKFVSGISELWLIALETGI